MGALIVLILIGAVAWWLLRRRSGASPLPPTPQSPTAARRDTSSRHVERPSPGLGDPWPAGFRLMSPSPSKVSSSPVASTWEISSRPSHRCGRGAGVGEPAAVG